MLRKCAAVAILCCLAASAARADHAAFTVQIKAFPVPILTGKGKKALGALSIFVQVSQKWHIAELCRLLPRFTEAVTLELDHSPIPVKERTYDMTGVAQRLYAIANESLKSDLVRHLFVIPGARRLGDGAAVLELDGTDEFCVQVTELPAYAADYPSAGGRIVELEAKARAKKAAEQAAAQAAAEAAAAAAAAEQAAAEQATAEASAKLGVRAGGDVGERACERDLTRYWPAGLHQYSGKWYWLSRVFTLDDNNDGTIDDVGFILKSEGLADIQVNYFPGPGRQSIVSVPTLRLADEGRIKNLCPNQQAYRKPPPGKGYPIGYKPPPPPPPTFMETIMAELDEMSGGYGDAVLIGGGVLVALLGGFGSWTVISRRRNRGRRG